MIRQIAEPILKQLEKIEKELGNHRMPQLPQIKFVKESEMGDGPFMIGDIEVTDELLEKVEAYIQTLAFYFMLVYYKWARWKCGCGEIGRRTRLRIWRLRRGGSSPFTRTTCKFRQLLR